MVLYHTPDHDLQSIGNTAFEKNTLLFSNSHSTALDCVLLLKSIFSFHMDFSLPHHLRHCHFTVLVEPFD